MFDFAIISETNPLKSMQNLTIKNYYNPKPQIFSFSGLLYILARFRKVEEPYKSGW
jgi:hypothetical protein